MNDAVTIGMAATAVGTVLWFLVKMMIDDFKRSVSGVGSKLDSTIARFDERVTKLEDKQEADIKAVQKELSSIKGGFCHDLRAAGGFLPEHERGGGQDAVHGQ